MMEEQEIMKLDQEQEKSKRIRYSMDIREDLKRRFFSVAYLLGKRPNRLLEELIEENLPKLEEEARKKLGQLS